MKNIFPALVAIVAFSLLSIVAIWYFGMRSSRPESVPTVHDTFALAVTEEPPGIPVVMYPAGEAFHSYEMSLSGRFLTTRSLEKPDVYTIYLVQDTGHLRALMRFRRDTLN